MLVFDQFCLEIRVWNFIRFMGSSIWLGELAVGVLAGWDPGDNVWPGKEGLGVK